MEMCGLIWKGNAFYNSFINLYLTFKNYRLCFFRTSSTIWIAHREQQFLLVIYFVLDKKESSCDIYGFSFNCTQNSPVVQLLIYGFKKKVCRNV